MNGSKTAGLRASMTDTGLFRKIYLITLSFEMIAFLDIISLTVKCVVLSWGLFILVHNCFIEKRAFKVRYKYLLWCFLALMVITSVVNMSFWFVPNLGLAAYTALCFFVFYGMYTHQDHEKTQKEMVFMLRFFVYFGLVGATMSLLMLFVKNDTFVFGYYLGIYNNRLIGIYTNSNILAFSMVEAVVACDILSDSYIKHKFKYRAINSWVMFICVLLSFVCLFLSDSNASFLFVISYCAMRVFCNMFFKNNSSYGIKFFRSIIIVTGFCVVTMSVSFAMRGVCQSFISTTINDVHKREEAVKYETDIPAQAEALPDTRAATEEKPELHIGREHYEVSSGRITLFRQGIEIFRHHPIIGIGRANLRLYSKKYFKNGLIHPDLHNGYLTILVSYGIVGFCVFALFSFLVAMNICKHLFVCSSGSYFGVFSRLFSALVAYCGYCLFEKAILFDMTYMVGFFWFMLGCAVSYMYSQGKKIYPRALSEAIIRKNNIKKLLVLMCNNSSAPASDKVHTPGNRLQSIKLRQERLL